MGISRLTQYRSEQASTLSDDKVVVFDASRFGELYPNIKRTENQLDFAFTKATMLLRNDKHSCVCNMQEREALLYLLVAHISTLEANTEGGNTSVGRASSAAEGSVSVSLDYGTTTNAEKWYTQTPYGAEYWALTSRYRSFLYTLGEHPMNVWRGING